MRDYCSASSLSFRPQSHHATRDPWPVHDQYECTPLNDLCHRVAQCSTEVKVGYVRIDKERIIKSGKTAGLSTRT
jgi:hypothetical protein